MYVYEWKAWLQYARSEKCVCVCVYLCVYIYVSIYLCTEKNSVHIWKFQQKKILMKVACPDICATPPIIAESAAPNKFSMHCLCVTPQVHFDFICIVWKFRVRIPHTIKRLERGLTLPQATRILAISISTHTYMHYLYE